MESSSSILVIYTGGTIGMVADPDTGVLQPFDFGQLYEQIPVLERFHFKIDCYSFDPIIDSSNMSPLHWIRIAEVIEDNYESYDGFVILHGSDTMSYSASGLSFILENLNKPVVFTGSQLPLGGIRSDGRDNLIAAIEIASTYEDETPVVPEVTIYFENFLLRGNRTIKYNAENFEAFRSENYPPLAEAGVKIKFNHNLISRPNFRKLKVHRRMDPHISILKLFPGIQQETVGSIVATPGLKAIVLETFGTGNAPTNRWLTDMLADTIDKGITVLNVSQCHGGSVEMGKYETSVELKKTGVISGHDITTESAVAKLMFLLGQELKKSELERMLETPLRGEMTVKQVSQG